MAEDNRMFPGKEMYCEGRLKPKLRGLFHCAGLIVLIPCLLAKLFHCIDNVNEMVAVLVLSGGTFFSWGSSALFHCLSWSLNKEIKMQRLDHSAVFVNIGSSYTAVALLVIAAAHDAHDLIIQTSMAILWSACLFGVWHVFNRHAERMSFWVGSILLSFPSYPIMSRYMTVDENTLAVLGLLVYMVGAIIYGKRVIDPFPSVFGFHEIFHIFTILAALCTFYIVFSLCQSEEWRCNGDNKLDFVGYNQFRNTLEIFIGAGDFCTVAHDVQHS